MERLNPTKILLVAANWLGDAVMATPAMAALRRRFPDAHITAVARPYAVEVLEGLDCLDEVRGLEGLRNRAGLVSLVRDALGLRAERFDLAVTFANSFRTALFAYLAGAGRRVGYSRECRGFLLTDSLRPVKSGGEYAPRAMIDYYLELVGLLGAPTDDRGMRLGVTPRGGEAAGELLSRLGVRDDARIALVCPGAAFGSAKCWPPENFAAVADALVERGFEVLVATGPREGEIGERIAAAARADLKPLWRAGVPLGIFKALVARSRVMVTNDSGPRHFGAALGVPVVTIMGPSDPRWSDTGYEREILLRKEVECGPCMLRICPLDHSCMTLIKPQEVVGAVERLVPAAPGESGGVGGGP